MATYKYQGRFNPQKLRAELLGQIGQEVTVAFNTGYTLATVEVPDWVTQSTVDQVVQAHAADARYTVQAAGGAYQNAGAQSYGTGDPLDPTNSSPDGVFIAEPPGIEWPIGSGTYYQIVIFSDGTPLIAMSREAGFAVQGDAFAYIHSGTALGITRHSQFGVTLPSGRTLMAPMWRFVSDLSDNLLTTNTDFESGDFTDWTVGVGAKISVSTDQAHGGLYSFKIAASPTADDYIERSFDVAPLTYYTFSMWTYRQAAMNSRMTISWYDSGAALISTDAFNGGGATGAWDQGTPYSVISPDGAATCTIKVWYQVSGAADLYIDDISVTANSISREVYFAPNFTLPDGPLTLGELATPDVPISGFHNFYFNSTSKAPKIQAPSGADDLLLYGKAGSAVSFANDANANTIIDTTIRAGALGTKGYIRTRVYISHLSNSSTAGNRTLTVTYNFGAYSIAKILSPTNSINRSRYWFEFITFLDQSASAQRHQGLATILLTPTINTWTLVTTTEAFEGSSTVDTSAAVGLSVTAQMGGAVATVDFDAIGQIDGPFYAA